MLDMNYRRVVKLIVFAFSLHAIACSSNNSQNDGGADASSFDASAHDAGDPTDAGHGLDGSSHPDATTHADATVNADATVGVDANADAGFSADATSGADAQTSLDAAPHDSGVFGTGACVQKACLTSISNQAEWDFVAGPMSDTTVCDVDEYVQFVFPKDNNSPFQETIYIDVKTDAIALTFLRRELPQHFSTLNADTFFRLFQKETDLEYYTGKIFRISSPNQPPEYGFTIETAQAWAPAMTQTEVAQLRTKLTASFHLPLGYAPQGTWAINAAKNFQNPPFPLYLPELCPGEGCGPNNEPCLVIPSDTELCGHFVENRSVELNYERKIKLELISGNYTFPNAPGTTAMNLFASGELGPNHAPIQPAGPGVLVTQDFGGTLYYTYKQSFSAGSDVIDFNWSIYFPPNEPFALREPQISDYVSLYGMLNQGQTFEDTFQLGSCKMNSLPEFYAEAQFANGDSILIQYKHELPAAGSGPWLMRRADVVLDGNHVKVEDYWNLVYAGLHHNWDNQMWIIFPQPIMYDGHPIYGIWIDEDDFQCCPPSGVYTLDQDLTRLDTLNATIYVRGPNYN